MLVKTGVDNLSNAAKELADRTPGMLSAGKQAASEKMDHGIAAMGHSMRIAAEKANAKATELQKKIGPNATAAVNYIKTTAGKVHTAATPVLHHASGELTKVSQKVADKVNTARVVGAAALSSAGAHASRKFDETYKGGAAAKASGHAGMVQREANSFASKTKANAADSAKERVMNPLTHPTDLPSYKRRK